MENRDVFCKENKNAFWLPGVSPWKFMFLWFCSVVTGTKAEKVYLPLQWRYHSRWCKFQSLVHQCHCNASPAETSWRYFILNRANLCGKKFVVVFSQLGPTLCLVQLNPQLGRQVNITGYKMIFIRRQSNFYLESYFTTNGKMFVWWKTISRSQPNRLARFVIGNHGQWFSCFVVFHWKVHSEKVLNN